MEHPGIICDSLRGQFGAAAPALTKFLLRTLRGGGEG